MKNISILLMTTFLITGCLGAETDAPVYDATEIKEDDVKRATPTETPVLEGAAFSCPHSETRDIYFSSSTLTDSLKLDVIGEECDDAILKMTITTSSGQVIYEHGGRALSFVYDFYGAEGVEYMLKELTNSRLFSQTSIKSAAELPSYAEISENEGFYDVDEVAYINARDKNLPVFCHSAGKTYSVCLVYSEGEPIRLFETGS